MIRLTLLVCLIVFLPSAQTPSTTDWRGLAPLKSNRMDVERTLGQPDKNRDNNQLTYYFPDMVVYFYFNGNPKCRQKLAYTSWDVTPDTVTAIDVDLRHPPLIEETGIDLTKFKKTRGAFDMMGSHIYLNDDNSFAIEAGPKYVVGYHYRAGIKQKDLLCERSDKP